VANNYFQFKEFTIHQNKCAMKVCTDACLLGAFVADSIQSKPINNLLDIGTGTGLLSLLLAQKINTAIDAVEIDPSAYEQAKENIALSPWKESIHIFNSGIVYFTTDYKYDFIISNPPFFEADLKSDDEKKNFAKHDTSLTLPELLNSINRLLSPDGSFAVLLPYHRVEYFINESKKYSFHLVNKVSVKQTPKHPYFRAILLFSRVKTVLHTNEICIKNDVGNYSQEFTALLKDYYLHI
jgi:tRNA1Val (adenine37-N6)-methyltransferase